MFRPQILRTLIRKDASRLAKNTPAVMLLGLMVLLAVLLDSGIVSQPEAENQMSTCWLVYWNDGPWVDHLRERIPPGLPIRIVDQRKMPRDSAGIRYPAGQTGIELRHDGRGNPEGDSLRVLYRYPGDDPAVLWPASRWFLSASIEYFGNRPPLDEELVPIENQPPAEGQPVGQSTSVGELMSTQLVGTMLLFSVQFVACCALFVSLTSQEREQGTLQAVAMSPATPLEILASKIVLHLVIALGLSAAIVAILHPPALRLPVFWLVQILMSLGLMSVGTIIVSWAKLQSHAGLLSFCYVLGIGVATFLAGRFAGFAVLRRAMFEHYGFVLTYASLDPRLDGARILDTLALIRIPTFTKMVGLVTVWLTVSAIVFLRRGWR